MYGCVGPFCFGKEKSPLKNQLNIQLNTVKSQLVNSISSVVSKAKDEITVGQVQNVTINGYVSNGPDIIISQNLKLKSVSNSKLSSVINDETLKKVADDLDSQMKKMELENKEILSNPEEKALFENIRKNMIDVIKSDSTKKVLQTKVTSSLSIQNQEIYINFSNKVGELILDDVKTTKAPDGRPVIEITQDLINDIYVETVMKNLVGVIVNNQEIVADSIKLKEALAKNTMKDRQKNQKKLARASMAAVQEIKNEEKNNKKKYFLIFLIILILIFIFFFF